VEPRQNLKLLQEMWKIYFDYTTPMQVASAMEYVLVKERGLPELEVARLVGRYLGNIFKSRESLLATLNGEP
jgi:hypothetical protein